MASVLKRGTAACRDHTVLRSSLDEFFCLDMLSVVPSRARLKPIRRLSAESSAQWSTTPADGCHVRTGSLEAASYKTAVSDVLARQADISPSYYYSLWVVA